MKKIYLLSLFVFMIVFNLMADALTTIPVATLTHDGVARQFYGATALADAHTAAVSGDVITLSGGTFAGTTITKGITLRGECAYLTPEMQEAGMRVTSISSEMRIRVPQSDPNPLKIEDMYYSGRIFYIDSVSHIILNRMCIYYNNAQSYAVYVRKGGTKTVDVINCAINIFRDSQSTDSTQYNFVNSTFHAINCVYNSYWGGLRADEGYMPKNINATNCYIMMCGNKTMDNSECVFTNCITGQQSWPIGTTLYNCVSEYSNFIGDATYVNCLVSSYSTLYGMTSRPSFPFTDTLTETAAATYLGTDGTQVGIYGGLMPFTWMPDNPVVTRCDIAGKTTEDGKLNVEIEVKSVQ